MPLGRIYYNALATASWVSIFRNLFICLTFLLLSIVTVSSITASFLHVCIHHLLSTLYAGPLTQHPASWTGNWNRCLLLWFSKQWPCKLQVSALPSPRGTELHPQVWGSTYGFPRSLCWGVLWSLGSEQRMALAGISTQQGPHFLSLGSLDIACSYWYDLLSMALGLSPDFA